MSGNTKQCELKISSINSITSKREYINESLLASGFNLSKSITVKPDSSKDIIIYEQK